MVLIVDFLLELGNSILEDADLFLQGLNFSPKVSDHLVFGDVVIPVVFFQIIEFLLELGDDRLEPLDLRILGIVGLLEMVNFLVLALDSFFELLDLIVLLVEIVGQVLVYLPELIDLRFEEPVLFDEIPTIFVIKSRLRRFKAGKGTEVLADALFGVSARIFLAAIVVLSILFANMILVAAADIFLFAAGDMLFVAAADILGHFLSFLDGIFNIEEHHLGAVDAQQCDQNLGEEGRTIHL